MKLEALRAATPVGPKSVAAALLAPAVFFTLVLVYTEGTGLIKLESSWTDTLEAAFCVLAGAWSWAETLLLEAFIHIKAFVAILCVSRRAHAHVAPLSVHTLVLAVVLASSALVQVPAGSAVPVEFVARRAPALVRPKSVMAELVTGRRALGTLVYVVTPCPATVRAVSSVTDTPVGAHGVDTGALLAESWHGLAFVNVLAIRP